jgi:hypothetical protein
MSKYYKPIKTTFKNFKYDDLIDFYIYVKNKDKEFFNKKKVKDGLPILNNYLKEYIETNDLDYPHENINLPNSSFKYFRLLNVLLSEGLEEDLIKKILNEL